MNRFIFYFLISCILAMFIMIKTYAADVTLIWDANTEQDLAGYKIYYDEGSGVPYIGMVATQGQSPIIVPLVGLADMSNPEFTLNGFDDSKSYYFVVTAYDNETPSLESDHSNEVMLQYRTDGPPAKTTLRQVFWKLLQAFWHKITGKGLRVSWS